MTICNHCGGFVTPDFARVFGDNEDEVFGCPDCKALTDLVDGTAEGTQP